MVAIATTILWSCSVKKENAMTKNKVQDKTTGNNKVIITAPLVEKSFMKKNGVSTGRTEWYIERSVQDYFIKFCESKITREALEKHLKPKKNNLIQTLTLEVEFKEGSWDICDENYEQQSRIGNYVIIHRIIEH